jgi:serine/alanine adding enzyme
VNTGIKISTTPDFNKWKDFVDQHPCGNIFQSPVLFNLYQSVSGYEPGIIAAYDHNNNICGILAYNIIYEKGIKRLFTGRSIITGGPLTCNNDKNISEQLLHFYNQHIGKRKIIYTQIRNQFHYPEIAEVHQSGFKNIDHLTVHIDLEKNEKVLLSEMHPKRSANIKRALKKSLVIKELKTDEEIEQLFLLLNKTYKRISVPGPPKELIINIKKILGQHSFMIGAYAGEQLIGARIYLLYRHIIYDWYACSDLAYSNLLPNDILPWKAMLWAKDNHYKIYDFAGAGHPLKPYGVRDYKIKFGGTIKNLGRLECIHSPVLYYVGKTGLNILKYLSKTS